MQLAFTSKLRRMTSTPPWKRVLLTALNRVARGVLCHVRVQRSVLELALSDVLCPAIAEPYHRMVMTKPTPNTAPEDL